MHVDFGESFFVLAMSFVLFARSHQIEASGGFGGEFVEMSTLKAKWIYCVLSFAAACFGAFSSVLFFGSDVIFAAMIGMAFVFILKILADYVFFWSKQKIKIEIFAAKRACELMACLIIAVHLESMTIGLHA